VFGRFKTLKLHFLNFEQQIAPAFNSQGYRLSRGQLQRRANKLVRELHLLEDPVENHRIVEGQSNGHSAAIEANGMVRAQLQQPGPQTAGGLQSTIKASGNDNNNDVEVEVVEIVSAPQRSAFYSDVEVVASPASKKLRESY
jgi:regulatory protein YycI of two-component signal transduction system YycFG